MKKLCELFGLPNTKGDVGIEIECEGENLRVVEDGVWVTTRDNSLRGRFPDEACEWVLAKPIKQAAVRAALDTLAAMQQDAKVNMSLRTSVHIHINVCGLTDDQVRNFIYTCLIIDTMMMNHNRKTRLGNRFCLRVEDAPGVLRQIMPLFTCSSDDWRILHPNDRARYASVNIEAMWKYGSIELRGMDGNLSPERIDNWVKAYLRVRQFAMAMADVRSIHDLFVNSSPAGFVNAVLGVELAAVYANYKGFDEDLRRSFALTIDIPYRYAQWRRKYFGKKQALVVKKVDFKWEVVPVEEAFIRARPHPNPNLIQF